MLKIIFIGVLHCGFTPLKELEQLILSYKPNQLFVEIKQEDIDSNNIENYPPEMIFASRLAIQKQIHLKGFDSNINITTSNSTKEQEETIIKKQEEIIQKYDWKNFNKEKYDQLLKVEGWDGLIDEHKWLAREEEMENNIKKILPQEGTVLVITGAGHISFFKKVFPKASFPLN